MRIENFDKSMQKIIDNLVKEGIKPKLLLHSCCAPCFSACLERIKDYFDITVFYYNPNLDSAEEFTLRAKEQERLCAELKVNCVVVDYNNDEFLSAAKGLESEREGGARCTECFNLRLSKTALFAKENGFDYFATTLTVSPLKNAKLLNEIGEKLSEKYGVKYLPTDFKKRGGYQRSIELSREYNLYRQNYCGCAFSKNLIPNG
ncbi:MAG: epoxyqueuosine reductase QueH [Clostridiales bacterium]|nr:epoxyqueuosine reductase QueH [Clostridiales bacterium]